MNCRQTKMTNEIQAEKEINIGAAKGLTYSQISNFIEINPIRFANFDT